MSRLGKDEGLDWETAGNHCCQIAVKMTNVPNTNSLKKLVEPLELEKGLSILFGMPKGGLGMMIVPVVWFDQIVRLAILLLELLRSQLGWPDLHDGLSQGFSYESQRVWGDLLGASPSGRGRKKVGNKQERSSVCLFVLATLLFQHALLVGAWQT